MPKQATVREPLTRDRIIEEALRIMDAEGLEAVSMRRLGRELGVEAMSLYNHVASKEDLLGGVEERVLAGFDVAAAEGDWIERLRAMARSFRALLREHPALATLITSHQGRPLTDPAALRPVEAVLDTLRGAGLSDEDTIHAYRALVGFVMGNVLLERGGFFSEWSERADWPDAETMASMLPADVLPNVVAMLPAMWSCDADAEFEHGLDTLLAGLRTRLMEATAGG